jgi:hypothetical protein
LPNIPFFAAPPLSALAPEPPSTYLELMTQLLERAFAAASQLPETEQDAFASLLLSELESERRWSESFAASQGQLSALANEALRELAAGETEPLDLNRDLPNH